MFRVDQFVPTQTIIALIRLLFSWSAFRALGSMQGSAGSVPAGGPPRLLPSPRRPLSKRGCGTARRWYTAGLSAFRLFFSLFLGLVLGNGGGIGAMIWGPPFPPNPFFYRKGTGSGAEGPRRCSGLAHTVRHHPGIAVRGTKGGWGGQPGPTSGSPRGGSLRWTLQGIYGRREQGRGPKAPDVVPRWPPPSPPAGDHHCPNSILVLLGRVCLSGFRLYFLSLSHGRGLGEGGAWNPPPAPTTSLVLGGGAWITVVGAAGMEGGNGRGGKI